MTERPKDEEQKKTETLLTPDLDGTMGRVEVGQKKRWVVISDATPTVDYAVVRTSELPEHLRPQEGLRVSYDLETVPVDDGNHYYARNVREYQHPDRQKTTPKNRR